MRQSSDVRSAAAVAGGGGEVLPEYAGIAGVGVGDLNTARSVPALGVEPLVAMCGGGVLPLLILVHPGTPAGAASSGRAILQAPRGAPSGRLPARTAPAAALMRQSCDGSGVRSAAAVAGGVGEVLPEYAGIAGIGVGDLNTARSVPALGVEPLVAMCGGGVLPLLILIHPVPPAGAASSGRAILQSPLPSSAPSGRPPARTAPAAA
ncbi:hypothetical protein DIPPA_34437 [Diplonema papillatum]|nr:hypothetical protein DIPPA_34437 [Diplonema papillatum]